MLNSQCVFEKINHISRNSKISDRFNFKKLQESALKEYKILLET